MAYSGITSRAVVASLTSDLENANKQLVYYLGTNTGYPTAIDCSSSPAANTICLKGSMINGTPTTYQYTVNNTVTPQTYYVTATSGSISYYIGTSVGTPTSGGCWNTSGAITNLVSNPGMYTSSTGYGTLGTHTITWTNGPDPLGSNGYTTSTPGGANGDRRAIKYVFPSSSLALNTAYTFSAYVRVSAGAIGAYIFVTNFDTYVNLTITNVVASSAPIGTWARVSGTFTTLPTGPAAGYGVGITTTGDSTTETIDTSNWLLTQGTTLYNYADGNSNNWTWNGTVNNSTSTGLPV